MASQIYLRSPGASAQGTLGSTRLRQLDVFKKVGRFKSGNCPDEGERHALGRSSQPRSQSPEGNSAMRAGVALPIRPFRHSGARSVASQKCCK
jgi:hypothetical protein